MKRKILETILSSMAFLFFANLCNAQFQAGTIPESFEECVARGQSTRDLGFKGTLCQWSVLQSKDPIAYSNCLAQGGGRIIIEADLRPGSTYWGDNVCKLSFLKPSKLSPYEYALKFVPDLKQKDPSERLRAVQQIIGVAAQARAITPHIVKLLDDSDSGVRFSATQVLTYLQDPSSLEALKKLKDDPAPDVRFESFLARAGLKDRTVAYFLASYLDHSNPDYRARAAQWFGIMLDAPLRYEKQNLWMGHPEKALEWWTQHKDDPEFKH